MSARNNTDQSKNIESYEPLILMSASAIEIEGTDAGEWISGTDAENIINAGGGNDEIHAPIGNNVIDGGAGYDSLVIYEGVRDDYQISIDADGNSVIEGPGGNGQTVRNVIMNVEQVIFNDGWATVEELREDAPVDPGDPDDPTDPDHGDDDPSISGKSGSGKSGSGKSGSGKSGSGKSGSGKSGSGKSGSGKSGSGKSGSGKSGSGKSGSGKSGSGKSGSGKSGSGKSGSGKSGSGKSGSGKSGSDLSSNTPPPTHSEKIYGSAAAGEGVQGWVLDADHDFGPDVWVDVKSWPTNGYIMVTADGEFDYIPYYGFTGHDVFEVVIMKGHEEVGSREVCVKIGDNVDPSWPDDSDDGDDIDDPSGSGKSGSGKSGSGKSGSGKSGSGKSGSGKSGSGKSGSGKSGSGKSGSGKSGSGKSGSGKSGSGKSGSGKSGDTTPPVEHPDKTPTIVGTDIGEWITAGTDDVVAAKGGNDEIYAPNGVGLIDGGAGVDSLVIYEGSRAEYTFYRDAHGNCVVEGPGANGQIVTQTIKNVEKIIFNDGWVSVSDIKDDGPIDPEEPDEPSSSGKSGSGKSGSGKSRSGKSGSGKSGSGKSGSGKSGSGKSGSGKSGSGKSGSGKSGKSGSGKSGSGKSGKSGSGKSGSGKSGSGKSGSGKSRASNVHPPVVYPPADHRPNAVDDSFYTSEDVPVWGNVLTNDSVPNGNHLTVSLQAAPTHGYLSLNSDGAFDYVPKWGWHGSDSFRYSVSDGKGGVDHATVTILVEASDDADDDASQKSGSGKSGSGKSGSGKSGSGKSGSGKSGSGKSGSGKSGSGKSGSGKSGSGKSGKSGKSRKFKW